MRLIFLLLTLLCSSVFAQTQEPPPALAARAWILIDHNTGQVLAAQGADQKVEPASLTKMMTSYVVYAALRDGKLKRDQLVPISVKAWKAPGSRMFVDPKSTVTVEQLIHGMVIQSGNDASIALAEAVGGSEEAFANLMNAEAKRLGMNGTHFINATGLPDPAHMTTVQDLAVLSTALIRDFPEDYKTYAIKDYTWNKIKQYNRNRLLWIDPAVDGVKTGHTDTAGFCLVASRNDGARRLTAVVVGTASDNARMQETLTLLNYGVRAYDAVKLYDKGQVLSQLKVFRGAQSTVGAGFAQDLVLSLPRGIAAHPERLKVEVASRQPLLAPIAQGDTVATLRLLIDGQVQGEFPLLALTEVPVAGLIGRTIDSIKLWFQR